MQYTIGEFAKMLGLSVDTLRHYEKAGIIEPHKDESNGYRYYEYYDSRKLATCKLYRSMGFSLTEAGQLLNAHHVGESAGLFAQRIEQLENEIDWHQKQLRILKLLQKHIKQAQLGADCFGILQLPALYRLRHSYGDAFYQDSTLSARVQQWIDLLPVTYYSRRIKRPVLEGKKSFAYDMGLVVKQQDAQQYGLAVDEPVRTIPAKTYLYTIIKKPDSTPFTLSHVQPLLQKIKKEGCTSEGDCLVFYLMCDQEDGIMNNYHMVMLAVNEEEELSKKLIDY